MNKAKWMLAGTALLLLAACSHEPVSNNAATRTDYQQLSRVEWTEMTSADSAAQVNNNFLIMMR